MKPSAGALLKPGPGAARRARAITLAAAGAALFAACAAPVRIVPPEPGATAAPGPAEAARHRAALARITVVNRTTQRLAIGFRPATPPGGPIGVGSVEPGATVLLAPVPAGEPIILFARTTAGAVHELHPRSFEVDADWTWTIERNAVFRVAEGAP
jgi:hypothetical protein